MLRVSDQVSSELGTPRVVLSKTIGLQAEILATSMNVCCPGSSGTSLVPLLCPLRQGEKQAGRTAHGGGDPGVSRGCGGQENVWSTTPAKWLLIWAPQVTAFRTGNRTFRP